jgi:CheY-like chemotaxis protein
MHEQGKLPEVLIVDDMYSNRLWVRTVLRGSNYRVEEATNGREALERIQMSKPDLVILDMYMPEMDGIQLCRELKAREELKDILVIMVTCQDENDGRLKSHQAGCDAFMTKPIKRIKLLGKIRMMLNRRDTERGTLLNKHDPANSADEAG